MQNPQQQIAMQVAQALQQGADPRELMGELVKMGMAQDQAAGIIQSVMQSMQGQSQMAKGGYTGTWSGNQGFAYGGVSPYNYTDAYSTMMSMGGRVNISKAQKGIQTRPSTTSYNPVPPPINPEGDVPREQDYPDYDTYMRALSSYYTNQYLPGIDLYNEPGAEDVIGNIAATSQPTDGYQNPALATITTPAAVVAPQATVPASSGYGKMHPEYSIVDLLNSLGAKSDYATRKKLAKELGIESYRGRWDQNLDLIKRLSKFHNEIQQNPNDYDIAKLIAGADTPTPKPGGDSTKIPIVPIPSDSTSSSKTPFIPTKKPIIKTPGEQGISGEALAGIYGVGTPLAGYLGYKSYKEWQAANRNAYRAVTKAAPIAEKGALDVTRNKLLEKSGKDLQQAYEDFKKLPKRQQESLIKDEKVKAMLDEARAEEALASAHETQAALQEAAAEAAIPSTKAGEEAIKAAEMARAARIAERTGKVASRAMGWLRGLGEAMKKKEFQMGGGYIPSYGEYAYGGYHSEIPRLFNQPVDRPNKAMYGMGMARGGVYGPGPGDGVPETDVVGDDLSISNALRRLYLNPGSFDNWVNQGLRLNPITQAARAVSTPIGYLAEFFGSDKDKKYRQEHEKIYKDQKAKLRAAGVPFAKGGQMPKWLAERKFAAAGNTDKLSDYGYQTGGVVEIDPADYEATVQRLRDGGYQFEVLH